MDKLAKQQKAAAGLKKNASIGFGSFLGLTASMVLTVYEYPTFAQGGWSLILFLLVAGFCFFLPIALAAAEMGTVRKWRKLGVYIWVRDTLGPRWGFYAIFGQWAEITVGFIAMLYAITSGLGFVFGGTQGFDLLTESSNSWYGIKDLYGTAAAPGALYIPITNIYDGHSFSFWHDGVYYKDMRFSEMQIFGNGLVDGQGGNSSSLINMQNHQVYSLIEVAGAIFGSAVLIFLGLVVGALFGAEWVAKYSKWGFWGGIAVPTAIVVILGIIYLAQGHQIFQDGSYGGASTGAKGSIFTRGGSAIGSFGTFAAVIVAFAGPEGSANLANRLKNVNRNYPLAVITLLFLSVAFGVFAGIFIALTTQGAVNSAGGLSITYITLFLIVDPHMSVPMAESATRVITLIICLGLIGEVMSWVLGPSTGMHVTAEDGLLPSWFKKKNRFDVPWAIVLVQSIAVIAFEAIITLCLGSVSAGSFNAGLQVTVLIYMMTYMLLFIAHMRMWTKAPDIQRAFTLKRRWFGFFIGFLGWLCVTFAWCASWLNVDGVENYIWFPVLFVIWFFACLVAVVTYESMRIWNKNQILKKYGFNNANYPAIARRIAKKIFLLKLADEQVPEIVNSNFQAPILTNPTPDEIREEMELKRNEKNKVSVNK